MLMKRRSLPDSTPLSDSEDESSSQLYETSNSHSSAAAVVPEAAPSTTPPLFSRRLARFAVAFVCVLASFLAGRLAASNDSPSNVASFVNATTAAVELEERISRTLSEAQHPRLPLNKQWLDHEATTCENPLTMEDKDKQQGSTSTTAARFQSRMQYFSELVIHPTLLAMARPATSVAVVLDEIEDEEDEAVLETLLQQLSLHQSLQQVKVVVEGDEDLEDCQEAVSDLTFQMQVQCVSKEELATKTFDAVFLLDDCDVLLDDDEDESGADEDDDFTFWKERLSTDIGTLVTCAGQTLPLNHPRALQRFQDDREDLLLVEEDGDRDEQDTTNSTDLHSTFAKVIEYDIRLPSTSQQQQKQSFAFTIAVAMKNSTSMAQWRLNSAHYQRRVHQRLASSKSLRHFDAAAMSTLQYPSKQASIYSCQHYLQQRSIDTTDDSNHGDEDEDDLDYAIDWCLQDDPASSGNNHGYDSFIENVPITDLYMDKSQAGDHAGRGVFANRDIPAKSYVGLETTVHSVLYEWTTTVLHNDVKDFIPLAEKAHIIYVYAEAYGFSQDPWNMPQEAVMTHLLTFTNHGCNGTANLGDLDDTSAKWTEFTVDLSSGVVPEDFKTTVDVSYLPAFDRDQAKHDTMSRAGRFIRAGEELYDNYMSFGGDQYFVEMVETLRNECSGSLGMVEQYQRKEKVSMVGADFGKKEHNQQHAHRQNSK